MSWISSYWIVKRLCSFTAKCCNVLAAAKLNIVKENQKDQAGVGKAVQLVKCLLHTHENLSSILSMMWHMGRVAGAGNHSHWEGRDSRNHGSFKGGSLVESTSPRSQWETLAQTIIGGWMASEEGPTRLTSGLRTHMFICTHTSQTFSHEHKHI